MWIEKAYAKKWISSSGENLNTINSFCRILRGCFQAKFMVQKVTQNVFMQKVMHRTNRIELSKNSYNKSYQSLW